MSRLALLGRAQCSVTRARQLSRQPLSRLLRVLPPSHRLSRRHPNRQQTHRRTRSRASRLQSLLLSLQQAFPPAVRQDCRLRCRRQATLRMRHRRRQQRRQPESRPRCQQASATERRTVHSVCNSLWPAVLLMLGCAPHAQPSVTLAQVPLARPSRRRRPHPLMYRRLRRPLRFLRFLRQFRRAQVPQLQGLPPCRPGVSPRVRLLLPRAQSRHQTPPRVPHQ